MSIIHHIRRDEKPLWQGAGICVRGEVVKVADPGSAGGRSCDGIMDNERIVLSNVVGIGAVLSAELKEE